MIRDSADYRKILYDSYLSSQGEALPEVLATHLAVRASHCRCILNDFFPANRDARILELGCGYGALLHYAMAAGYHDIQGVDNSPEQIAAAHQLGITCAVEGDCFDSLGKEADNSLEAIVSLDLIEHFDKPEVCRLAVEVARALKPSGRWILHCPNGESPFGARVRYGDFTHELCFTQQSLQQLLHAYGFGRVECFEDGPIAHGPKSAIRFILWRIVRFALRAWLVAETGQVDQAPIFTQNLFCIAYK
ncbi:MAG: class I SAM-dependent methyltransferase [Deltaproteobacteria bacterium]|nr:class I SAM-dependent methyltransferase [Deltaproteobacteria bacterium]